jgi:hypothetical protein
MEILFTELDILQVSQSAPATPSRIYDVIFNPAGQEFMIER